jgi:polysaccharide biosynthesis transport protein
MHTSDAPSHRGGSASGAPEELHFEEGLNLRNYALMVWERKWYALAVFLVVLLATGVYTFLSTPIYSGVATVQVLKHGPQVLRGAEIVESTIANDTDFNTQIKVLESLAILQNVVNRLTPEETKLLVDTGGSSRSVASPLSVIYQNRRIIPQRLTLITHIQFRHPNPKIAARIANLIASEYIAYNSRLRIEESLKAVDELKDRADQQRKRVDEIANALQAFRQRGNLISLMQSKDIVTERLKALNLMATQTGARLKEAEVRWGQVQKWIKAKRDLTELPFIASQSKVAQLLLQLTPQKTQIAQLRERYKDKHPRLIEAAHALGQIERELQDAVHTAAMSIKSEYENALQTDEAARKALADQEEKSLALDKSSVEYENLNRDFRVNEQLLESMLARMREASVSSSIETEHARIIDRAHEPAAPISPKIALNLAVGAAGGIFLAIGFAILLATLNDRIKTTFDVESLLRLPLIGAIPRVGRLEQPDKAQVVANGADRAVAEAFLSLYSSLRIGEDSRSAKLILVTSTIPGEGKSFIASNLALTFASQGHRTAIVDCDLRKPNVHRLLRLQPGRGLVNYCTEGVALDDAIARDVQPNLDVIPVGGRTKNPILLLNSKEFEALATELRARYDRVVFDTPPLAAVSDALNILPLMDGVVYTVRYNVVKRAMAQSCIRRLISANIPILGAVLNDVAAGSTADYYGESKKLFRDYYEANASPSAPETRSSPA